MSSPMPHQLSTHPFPPLSPPSLVKRTVFDNGVEAELGAIADRKCVPRDDRELLAASMCALRDGLYVPKGVVVRVHHGTVVLDGRTSFYYERAAAECAVRFLDGVRTVENHILVEPPALTRPSAPPGQ